MAVDFAQERLWKQTAARNLARACAEAKRERDARNPPQPAAEEDVTGNEFGDDFAGFEVFPRTTSPHLDEIKNDGSGVTTVVATDTGGVGIVEGGGAAKELDDGGSVEQCGGEPLLLPVRRRTAP